MPRSHLITLLIAGALTLAFAAACSSGDDGGTARGSARVICGALDDLKAYHYSVSVEMNAPSTAATTPPAETSTPGTDADPLAGFSEALSQLLSDFSVTGAWVAPDRNQATLKFGNDELEVRSVGEQTWVRLKDSWQEEPSRTNPVLTPKLICEDVVQKLVPSLSGPDTGQDSVDGVATRRYHASQASVQQLSPLIGTVEGEYTVDLWIAEGGGWPARLQIQSTTFKEAQPAFRLSMEITDAGDESIKVDDPPGGG